MLEERSREIHSRASMARERHGRSFIRGILQPSGLLDADAGKAAARVILTV